MAEAILVADDEAGVRESLAEVLRDAGYVVETAADGTAALAALDDAATSPSSSPTSACPAPTGSRCSASCARSRRRRSSLVMTAHGSVETAVEALRAGAADYILKPVVFDDVLAKVARVLEHRQLAWQTQMLRREVERALRLRAPGREERRDARGLPPDPEGRADADARCSSPARAAPARRSWRARIHHFSAGVGQDLPARQLRRHPGDAAREPALRPRARRVHRRRHGAGGALRPREGRHDLPRRDRRPAARASSRSCCAPSRRKEILPVGSTQPVTVDVRIITATNRDLGQMVEAGHVPRGPLLPPERRRRSTCRRCATAARTSPRWSSSSCAGTTAR